MIGEEGKRHYFLIKLKIATLLRMITLNIVKKIFCHYCLQAFSTKEILKCNIKDCCEINCKQRTIMPKNSEYVLFKIFERKIKSPFIIYVDFESILVPQNNWKQNPEGFYRNKYQKHISCSYGYKLVCVYDKFRYI